MNDQGVLHHINGIAMLFLIFKYLAHDKSSGFVFKPTTIALISIITSNLTLFL